MKKIIILIGLGLGTWMCTQPEPAVKAPGVVEGEIVTVKALVGGPLDKWLTAQGNFVRKDAVLGEISQDKILNNLEELRINLEEVANGEERARKKIQPLKSKIVYLKNQVERLERLKKDQAVAGEQLERTRLQLLDAETSLFELEKSIEAFGIERQKIENKRRSLELIRQDFIVRSPVEGVVLESYVTQGETLLPGTAMADILDTSSLFIQAFVEERELALLKLNAPAAILVDGLEGREFHGVISYFGKKAEFSPKYILSEKERKSLLYEVKVKIENNLDVFKVGMPVTVVFK